MNTTTTDRHRMVWAIHPDATDQFTPAGVTERQAADVRNAVAIARAVGSHVGSTRSDGVEFRATRRGGGCWTVAAVVPERDRIVSDATDLLTLLDAAVPSSTVHYAVEDARSALRELARKADSIVTQSAHLDDLGETYQDGVFIVTCSCGDEFTGADPSEANFGYMEHAEGGE